jgi:uncharacterized membrane protein YgdD (TMEM256/DUF423 family)
VQATKSESQFAERRHDGSNLGIGGGGDSTIPESVKTKRFNLHEHKMPRITRTFLVAAALSAALAVAFGAFATHALRGKIDTRLLEVFQTGVQYHMFHSLGLAIVGFACGVRRAHASEKTRASRTLQFAGWLMLAGIVLFSGSLYLLAFTGVRWWGAITPLGGIAFVAAWVLLALALWRTSRD